MVLLPTSHCISLGGNMYCTFADSGNPKKDLGHILDFVTRLKYLKVMLDQHETCASNQTMLHAFL